MNYPKHASARRKPTALRRTASDFRSVRRHRRRLRRHHRRLRRPPFHRHHRLHRRRPQAFADLDGDTTIFSTYERSGAADRNGVNAAAGLYTKDPTE